MRGPWWWCSLGGAELSWGLGWKAKSPHPLLPRSPPGCFPSQIPPGLWPFYRHFYSCWWELISLLVLLAQGFLAFTCRNMCRNPHAGEALSSMSQYIYLHSRNIRQSSSSSPTGFFPPLFNTHASNNIFEIILGCIQKEHTQKAGWLALIHSLIKHPESPSFGPSFVLG